MICLVETKTKYKSSIKFPNFHGYPSTCNNNSGGLYTGVKSSSIKEDIEITDIDNTDTATIKIIFVDDISLRIIPVYSPQESDSSDDKDKFYTDLETELEWANLSGDYYLVIGDFNAKLSTQYMYILNDIHEQSSKGLLLSKITERRQLIVLNGSDKCSGIWTRQNNKNSDEKSVLDYVLVEGEFYEYITKMNIDEDKFICPRLKLDQLSLLIVTTTLLW